MKFRKFVMVGVTAAAVAATAACGGGDDDSGLPEVTTSSSASTAADDGLDAQLTNASKRPSVEVLNEMLQKALNPKIPAADKTSLVEGSEVDPDLFDQLVTVAEDNPDVTYEIKRPVISDGPRKAKVKVEVKLPDNPPTKVDAAIVYDNGRWKLAKSTVCPLLSSGDVKSPLCADETTGSSKKTTSKKSSRTSSAN